MAAAPSAGPRASFLPIRSVNRTFGQAERLGYLHTLSCQPPALFFLFFSGKEVMKKIKKIGRVAGRIECGGSLNASLPEGSIH